MAVEALDVLERDAPDRRGERMPRTRAARAPGVLTAALLCCRAAAGGDIPLSVQEGTDFGVAVAAANRGAGSGELVMDLAGRLWRLPAGGGRATALTPAGEFARRPAFSADGQSIAWQALRDGLFQVIVADADGGNARQITSGTSNQLSPAWSPDGTRIAFSSDRGGDYSLWEIAVGTGELRQLTFEQGQELEPAWSPDGTSLAYVAEQAGVSSLLIRTPFQPARVLVTNKRPLRAPAWRPDGSVITYTAIGPQGPRLNMVILSDPPVIKPVAPGEAAFAAPVAWLDRGRMLYTADGHIRARGFGELTSTDIPFEATLHVSAVGDRLAKPPVSAGETRAVQGLAGMTVLPNRHLIVSALGDLWELDGAGALVRALTQDAYADRDPAISADGRWLAFTSDRSGAPQIWVMDLASGDSRPLTAETGFAGHPAWNSGADTVAYLAGDPIATGRLDLKIVNVSDRAVLWLAGDLREPGTPAWTPDGTRVGVVQREQGSTRLLLYPVAAAGNPRRVTLPAEAAGSGVNEVQWSGDGMTLLIASAAGIRTLPMLDGGLIGAEWRSLADVPAQLARWVPDGDAAMFTDATGLARAGGPSGVTRIPVPLTWRRAPVPGRMIIRATRVFDGLHAEYLPNHEVVIESGRIVALQPWFTATVAAADMVIDARGKTVMPGLIDLSIELPEGAGERLGHTLLAWGITTAQVLTAQSAELRELAERWQAHAAGPRLLQSPAWCGSGEWPLAPDPVLGEGAVRVCPAAIDHLPALISGKRTGGATIWSSSWLAAGAGLLDAVGPPAAAHAGPAEEALAGIGGFQNLYQDAVDVILRSGAVLVPALAARGLPVLVDDQPDLLDSAQYLALSRPEERRAQADAWRAGGGSEGSQRRAWLRDSQRLLGRISAGGGRLAAASGAPAVPYGLGLQAEIRLLAGAGLPRDRALQMATSEAARAVGLQDQIGSIAPGRTADLLIVAGDPLADLRQLLAIETVIVAGYPRPLASLLEQPPGAAEKFTPQGKSPTANRPGPRR